jgi:membrane associated rhomboid family serine protease
MFPTPPQEAPPRPKRVTRTLIVVNVAAFFLIWWMRASGVTWINAGYGMVPARLSADPTGEAIKLLTSLFVHDGLGHLLWNMIFLHIFGRKVEDALGRFRFITFYLIAGVASALAQFGIGPHNPIPLVGSSGAIAGILGGFLVLHPKAPVSVFRFTAWKVIGGWFVINVLGGLASLGGGASDTAFFAHLGGFVAGLLTIRLLISKDDGDDGWPSFREPPRVTKPKIFHKDEEGPFWHN